MSAPWPAPRGLYGITAEADCGDAERLLAAVTAALAGGLRLLQYRDKRNPPEQRAALGAALLARCRAAGVPLIVNDDIELAAILGADGVHLGLSDGSLAEARARLGPEAIIGITCADSLERARAAAAGGASYVAFGAFFPSRTKPNAPPMTLERLRQARAELHLPICAIGGISPERAPPLVAAGADYVAAIEGLFGAADIRAAARAYAAAFDGRGAP
ncbi:thiamine phosphate synthase [Stagnimonas aquatica]|uniref:Thiamine-phosphate synthase n=1 Tax=Stagnimonas aquatica TaxID=2689987 RepID=A0A3N0V8T1_9GAMM|nr:thiamine phosphate synthase [Stagnimonas aquatica]ROH88718.1 thiamine phosphate synthase [Stagnimonas aquatica]